MNLSEVIAKDKQRDGGFQVFPLAAERGRESCQPFHSKPHSQIQALHVASTNQVHIRVADPRLFSGAFEFGGTVARFFLRRDVNLNQLTIVNAGAKAQTNGVWISVHAVSGQLKLAGRSLVKFLNEYLRILASTSAKVPSQNQFATTIQGQEGPAIAVSLVVLLFFIPLFAIGESPQFIGLNFLSLYFAYAVLQELLAFVACNLENSQDRGDRHITHARRRANATAFRQAIKNAKQSLIRQIDRLDRFAGSLRERALTVAAFESGRFVLSEVSVKVGIYSAVIRALHRVPSSFLTGYTVRTTMRLRALLGIYGAGQVMSLRGASNTSSDSRLGLAETVGFKPTEPEGSADLQSAPIDRSGTSPSIQISSRLLLRFIQLLLPRWPLSSVFQGGMLKGRSVPFVDRVLIRVGRANCFACLLKSLENRVNAGTQIRVFPLIVPCVNQRFLYLYGSHEVVRRLEDFSARVGKRSLIQIKVAKHVVHHCGNGRIDAGQLGAGKRANRRHRLLKLGYLLINLFASRVKFFPISLNGLAFFEQRRPLGLGLTKGFFPKVLINHSEGIL